jgi:glyoxylase-like metal-dependent hydrolase (beta-lactamase superfamily II)
VPELPEWQWIATPGHSEGHVSLWRERDQVLIAGDAITTTRQESLRAVLRQEREVRPPPAYFTPDWQSAYDSMLRLRSLQPRLLASGHGVPAGGRFLRDGFESLVRNFPERGLPTRGRYVPDHLHMVGIA